MRKLPRNLLIKHTVSDLVILVCLNGCDCTFNAQPFRWMLRYDSVWMPKSTLQKNLHFALLCWMALQSCFPCGHTVTVRENCDLGPQGYCDMTFLYCRSVTLCDTAQGSNPHIPLCARSLCRKIIPNFIQHSEEAACFFLHFSINQNKEKATLNKYRMHCEHKRDQNGCQGRDHVKASNSPAWDNLEYSTIQSCSYFLHLCWTVRYI